MLFRLIIFEFSKGWEPESSDLNYIRVTLIKINHTVSRNESE